MTRRRRQSRTLERFAELEPYPSRDGDAGLVYPLGKPAFVDPSAMVVVAAVIAVGEQVERLVALVEALVERTEVDARDATYLLLALRAIRDEVAE